MDYQIVDIKGKEIGKKITLDKKVFGIESNNHVVYLAIKQYMANNRQGTHKAKPRAEIIGVGAWPPNVGDPIKYASELLIGRISSLLGVNSQLRLSTLTPVRLMPQASASAIAAVFP